MVIFFKRILPEDNKNGNFHNFEKYKPNRKGNNEVLIFDWDGNYISGFKLDRQLSRIEYDEINHTLFGLDSNETIYAYDLEGILP